MPTQTTKNPVSIIAGHLGPAYEHRIANALLLLMPDPELETEFRVTARAILENINEIDSLARNVELGKLDTKGLYEIKQTALAQMLSTVHETKLLPRISGTRARKYFALLAVEIALRNPDQINQNLIFHLANVVRIELDKLNADDASKSAIPDPKSLLDLISWVDSQPQKSERFPQYFWNTWKLKIKPEALSIIYEVVENELDTQNLDIEDHGRCIELLPDPQSQDTVLRGVFAPEPLTKADKLCSPGSKRVICEALYSTYTNLNSLTNSSTTVLSDEEVIIETDRLIDDVCYYRGIDEKESEQAALCRLLILASGTAKAHIPNLKWIDFHDIPPVSGGISFDGEWLLRRELVPNKMESYSDELVTRTVWVPIPPPLTKLLRVLNPEPKSYDPVFYSLRGKLAAIANITGISESMLRRTFFSRMARLEPLGITGAQWASGDSFGLSEAPLFYDRYPADRLANLIESVTFPWFSCEPGRSRKLRPKHFLGSRVNTSFDVVKQSLSKNYYEIPRSNTLESIIERINRRTWNIVHGLFLTTGHRPNDKIKKLTLSQFDLIDRIGILSDKAVSPEWQNRPVALAEPICTEIALLVDELRLLVKLTNDNELSKMATLAISGNGPLFLSISKVDNTEGLNEEQFRAVEFNKSEYFEGLDDELLIHPNYARHVLNQFLINRVPEILRVGQLGWNGTREGAWSDISAWSVCLASEKLQNPLNELLSNVGWKSLGCYLTKSVVDELPSVSSFQTTVDWIEQENDHQKEFRSSIYKLQKNEAIKQKQIIKQFLQSIKLLVSETWPQLIVDDNKKIQKRPDTNDATDLVAVKSDDIKKIALVITSAGTQQKNYMVINNFLCAIFRDARKRELIDCIIPQRSHWTYGLEPGMFTKQCVLALRDSRDLEEWLVSSNNKLSLESRTILALLHYGSYTDVDALLQVVRINTKLLRTRAYEDCVLAQPVNSRQTLAFHGLAALFLMRWHRDAKEKNSKIEELEKEIFEALPNTLKPSLEKNTLKNLVAMARVRNSLKMDGIARLIGTGRVSLTTVDAQIISAAHDNHPVMRSALDHINELVSINPIKQGICVESKINLDVKILISKLSAAIQKIDKGEITDSKARLNLRSELNDILKLATGKFTAAYLLIRFALALLDEGGKRKKQLELITIKGYIDVISSPLVRNLRKLKMDESSEHWQPIFNEIVASSVQGMRFRRYVALERFYKTLSQHISLPDVDFTILTSIAGLKEIKVDAGLLTIAESLKIAECLECDITTLNVHKASSEEIHKAKARELYYLTINSTTLRPGEAWKISISDVKINVGSSKIVVRKHKGQRLKTARARRQIILEGPLSEKAGQCLKAWIRDIKEISGSMFSKSQPLFGSLEDPSKIIEREDITIRINELIRWVTNNPDAYLYWTRKSNVRSLFINAQKSEDNSLWAMRDFLGRVGQADIRTTLTSYSHDPLAIFDRWMAQNITHIDMKHISQAINRSASRINRKRNGLSISGRRSKDVRSRIASFLEKIPFAKPGEIQLAAPPAIIVGANFNPSQNELDTVLRLIASGSDPVEIALKRFWPSCSAQRLVEAMESLRNDYSIGFRGFSSDAELIIDLPRRLGHIPEENFFQLIGLQKNHNFIHEMAISWLRYAAMKGLPDGVPGISSEWNRWRAEMDPSTIKEWDVNKYGAIECRLPILKTESKLSLWPMFRWQLIAAWLVEQVKLKQVELPPL